MNLSTFNKTELGYSHIKEGKLCQDYSMSYTAPDNSLFVAIVSDGHGGKTYCRSDRGSHFACEIAMNAMKGLPQQDMRELFKDRSGKVPVRKQTKQKNDEDTIVNFEDVYPQIRDIDPKFEHLFKHIYSQWVQRVENDWKNYPPTPEEEQLLGSKDVVKAYGATLMAFVRTPDYWFGFHIGDGKCMACDLQGGWYEPILWDSECFLNVTTSLCQSEAYKSFRYSFSGKGDFPIAVMLGTDGIDDSWGERLPSFYTSLLNNISNMGVEKAKEKLTTYLPGLSKHGSGDDVSIAWIVDIDAITSVLPKLSEMDLKQENERLASRVKQLEDLLKQIKKEQEEDKAKYNSKIKSFNEIGNNSIQNQIHRLEQKIKDLEKENKQLKQNKEDDEKNKKVELSQFKTDKESGIESLTSENEDIKKTSENANDAKSIIEYDVNMLKIKEEVTVVNNDEQEGTISDSPVVGTIESASTKSIPEQKEDTKPQKKFWQKNILNKL